MKTLVLIVITSLCLASCTDRNQTEILRAEVESLQAKNDSLAKILADKQPKSNYWFDEQHEGQKLIELGIKNPVAFIENNLREKTELIPLKAILGGTMHFGNIQLLGREWLIAEFDDGHIQGRAIYRYMLNEEGLLDFEMLISMDSE